VEKQELAAILRWLADMGLTVRAVRREGELTIVEIVLRG
jgi:hypothetical protein